MFLNDFQMKEAKRRFTCFFRLLETFVVRDSAEEVNVPDVGAIATELLLSGIRNRVEICVKVHNSFVGFLAKFYAIMTIYISLLARYVKLTS